MFHSERIQVLSLLLSLITEQLEWSTATARKPEEYLGPNISVLIVVSLHGPALYPIKLTRPF